MGLGSVLKKGLKYGVRAGTAIATGGGSELYRAKTGKADPVTAKGEELVDKAFQYEGAGPNETPEEKARREQQEREHGDDIAKARAYRDKLVGEPTPLAREAPQVTAPGADPTVHATAPGQISSTLNTGEVDEARRAQRAYQDRLAAIAEGKGGASAAEIAMRRGISSTMAQQYALAGGQRGYSSAALRAAGRNAAAISQEGISRTAELRAQEQAVARGQLGEALATGRQQDITIATAKGQLELDAARYNQAAELQVTLANAGFDNQAILHLSDQELQARLANAGFKLTQQQLDDLRMKTQRDQQLEANRTVIAASGADSDRQISRQQAEMMLEDARRRGSAADEQFWAGFLAKMAG